MKSSVQFGEVKNVSKSRLFHQDSFREKCGFNGGPRPSSSTWGQSSWELTGFTGLEWPKVKHASINSKSMIWVRVCRSLMAPPSISPPHRQPRPSAALWGPPHLLGSRRQQPNYPLTLLKWSLCVPDWARINLWINHLSKQHLKSVTSALYEYETLSLPQPCLLQCTLSHANFSVFQPVEWMEHTKT